MVFHQFLFVLRNITFGFWSDWMTLQDICKEKTQALNMTYPQIADETGIPLQTIRNFFSSSSKAPSINTAGPICKVLGISLDEYFGITDHLTPTEETLSAKNDTLRAHREELEHRVEGKAHTIELLERSLRFRRHIIYNLMAIIVLLLIWAIYLDSHCLDFGFWRG